MNAKIGDSVGESVCEIQRIFWVLPDNSLGGKEDHTVGPSKGRFLLRKLQVLVGNLYELRGRGQSS